MTHSIEPAKTGRAKCRGCNRPIPKDELRFGERVTNVFGDGETTLWFHLQCAAFKRPETFLEALAGRNDIRNASVLAAAADEGLRYRRLPRLHGAERAPTGRARCRACRQPIARGTWRLPLVYFEEYRFEPSGFVHASCAKEYFGTADLIERVRYFSPELTEQDLRELAEACGSSVA